MAHDKIDKKVMKGTIFMEVPDPQAKEVWSEKQQIGGFEWQAHMKRDAHRDRFVIICNSGCVDSLWLCRAKYTFEVREEDGEWTEWEEMGPNYFFNANNSVFETLLDANNERLKPNAVKAHIQVVWAPHESCFPDFDAILNVKYGKKSALFHVNRYILAYHSPTYFRNFFFGDWSERRTSQPKPLPKVGHNNELEIQDIEEKADLNLKAFGSMLYFVHHSALIVNQQDFLERFHGLLDIVELAVKYTFPMLVHHVEQCLIKSGSGTMEQLVVAEAQNLPSLKKHCLETLDLIEYGKNITENIALREKLGKATRQLLDKRIKETAERYSRKRKIFELEDDRYSNATDADDDSDYQALI